MPTLDVVLLLETKMATRDFDKLLDALFPRIDDSEEDKGYQPPQGITLKNRFEHTHILGGTGQGKTQLIQYLISRDLEEDCTVIVIDNQRQMIPKLAQLGYDMQYLSPRYPLALNIFDMQRSHTTASLLQYVLSALMNAPLTPKQELIFQFGVSLVLAHRGNIRMFQHLLGGAHFDTSILDETSQLFFETNFYTKQYEQTRQEISWRIWTLLKNPILRDMFNAEHNRCQLEIDRKLILIDTDVDLLQDYSGLVGRFFLAQLLQLAQHRFQGSHRPVYVYVDECYSYLDSSVVSMLETARKAKIGLILAHQFLGQITEPRVREALMSLTATKYAGGLSPSDSHAMAQAMHTKHTEFIDNQKKLNFALFMRGEGRYSIQVPTGFIENLPTQPVPDDLMIARYGRPPKVEPPSTVTGAAPTPTRTKSSPDDVDEEGEW